MPKQMFNELWNARRRIRLRGALVHRLNLRLELTLSTAGYVKNLRLFFHQLATTVTEKLLNEGG